MKIYTRTGDSGETSLFGGKRVKKHNLRVATYGEIDELNSLLGACISFSRDRSLKIWLSDVQRDLFTLGSWLASPEASKNVIEGKVAFPGAREARTQLGEEKILALEAQIDFWEKELKPMRAFILPGGTNGAALLHWARAVCRRAEREVVGLREAGELVPDLAVKYLNRLADALFVAARFANHLDSHSEEEWI